jgi:2-polyprenyl-3-methyl-5-hydroxy-6-metoxy-1,4-benzoquinol methylase
MATADSETLLAGVRNYWEAYADRMLARGTKRDPQEYFSALRVDHEEAYAGANDLLRARGFAGKSLLELGCGMGFDTITFAQSGARVTAVDLSGKCLELTRKHLAWYGLEADLRVANAECLDLPSEHFDIVTARGILMFTPQPAAILDQVWKVLRPGGIVQAILHNKHSWYVMLARAAGTNLIDPVADPMPNRLYTRRDVSALFGRFHDVAIYTDRFPTFASKRSGLASRLYNTFCVPMARSLPKRALAPFGYYYVVDGTKPAHSER